MSTQPNELTIDQRQAILQAEIAKYLRKGYIVQSQTQTSAQLVKHKRFSLLWALIWLCFIVIGLVIYVLWYMAKRDQTVYLMVDAKGKITRQ